MSVGLRRGLADLSCRTLLAILPPSLQSWGWAVRHETAVISDDTKALLFALDSLCGLMPRAVASRLLHFLAPQIGDDALLSGDSITMKIYDAMLSRPRIVGIVCATAAVMLGLAYMALAGAPARYLGVNVGALMLGLTALALFGRKMIAERQSAGGVITLMAGALLATAFLGDTVEGAARWVNVGGLSIQPSLILLPLMIVAFAQTRNAVATAGIIAAVIAMALQPDRAMAGMLALGLAVLAAMRPVRNVVAAFAASVVGFAVALVRADTLPPVPYVDQIFYSSFDTHALAGAAVLGGSALLLIPAIAGWSRDPANRVSYVAFGAVWLAGIVAAALGNYPTPIVGYGGSAIIGYVLSLLALPKQVGAHIEAGSPACGEADTTPFDRHLLVGTA